MHSREKASEGLSDVQIEHIDAFERLLQIIYVSAEIITDWDSVVDCLEQMVLHISVLYEKSTESDGANDDPVVVSSKVSPNDILRIFATLEKFKLYTRYFSDDALVRLTASLVALSMNNLAMKRKINNVNPIDDNDDETERNRNRVYSNQHNKGTVIQVVSDKSAVFTTQNSRQLRSLYKSKYSKLYTPEYLLSSILEERVFFSLQALIEISKINSFRIATVWQMVASHLRLIATLKVSNSQISK